MIKCQFEDGWTGYLRHVTVDVIVVNDNNKILLAKRSQDMIKEPGKWTLPCGFLDRDETVSEATTREAKEETGYDIKNLKLLRINSNPNRCGDDRQNVGFIYFANVNGEPENFDHETTEIKWFKLDQLPSKKEVAFDHYSNMELYKKYLDKKVEIPILDL